MVRPRTSLPLDEVPHGLVKAFPLARQVILAGEIGEVEPLVRPESMASKYIGQFSQIQIHHEQSVLKPMLGGK